MINPDQSKLPMFKHQWMVAISANGTDSTDLSWVDWNILKPLARSPVKTRRGGEVTSHLCGPSGLQSKRLLFVLSTGMSLNIWYWIWRWWSELYRIMMTQWPSWSWWCPCFLSCMCCGVFKMFSEMLQAHSSVPCVQGEFEVWSWRAWQACAHTASAWCTNPWPVSKIATLRFSLLFECVQLVSVCEELQSTFKILSSWASSWALSFNSLDGLRASPNWGFLQLVFHESWSSTGRGRLRTRSCSKLYNPICTC